MAALDEGAGRTSPASSPSLLDRLLGWRDRLLADPAFRARASRWPIGRFMARRRSRALFDLCAGFIYTPILLACIRLDLFAVLRERPLTASEIARRIRLTPERAERLLKAASAIDLLERRSGERWGLGPLGAACLDNPAVAAMVEHHADIAADFTDPVALLRGEAPPTTLSRLWTYAGGVEDAAAVAAYSDLMTASQPLVAAQVLDAFSFSRHRLLLDVGGGAGGFAAAVAARHPALEVCVFDLPEVAERARSRFAKAGLGARARAAAGDFRDGHLPRGADILSLVRILHDHDDPVVADLLRAAHDALEPGGTILIAEPLADAPGARPVGDAYFGFYLLSMGQGRPRRFADYASMLKEAGFDDIRPVRTDLPVVTGLITARRRNH
jgi:demethylspheroidene O-methyltransferase